MSLGHSWSHNQEQKVFLEIQPTYFNYLPQRIQISSSHQQNNSWKIVLEEGKKQMSISLMLCATISWLFQAIPMDWLPWPLIIHKNSNVELHHTQYWDQQMINSVPEILLRSSSTYPARLISLLSGQDFSPPSSRKPVIKTPKQLYLP